MDQVMAIENGGDDYIVKPFSPDVVMAKIRSQLRRAYGDYAGSKTERIVELNHLKLYLEGHDFLFVKISVLFIIIVIYFVEFFLVCFLSVVGWVGLFEYFLGIGLFV